jgi:hypothetical protein
MVNTKDWCKNDFEIVSQLRINTRLTLTPGGYAAEKQIPISYWRFLVSLTLLDYSS